MMSHSRLPLVADNHLRLLDREQPTPVVVGSDAWYNWLAAEQNRSFSFKNHLGTFTVRSEHKRRGWYWYVYCKREGKLRKAYVGKTQEVTLERLNAVAVALAGQDTEPLLAPASAFAHSHAHGQIPRHNLPAQFTSLIGREQEVTAACTLLQRLEVRLLTLTGTGGVGKTRLAVQVATELLSDFADGVCFVSLASISDPDLVLPTVAQTLGLQDIGDWPLEERLHASLREQHLLLLLDNFEQVVAAAPRLLDLLGACPDLKILVTSRAVLHVRGEYEFPVGPLALPSTQHLTDGEALLQCAATALFIERARAINPSFQITSGNLSAIAEICRRLDGLPLAIELAAVRSKLLPLQVLLTRLEHRLDVLTNASLDMPARQQTLRSALAWSHELLNAREQRLFRRLSVFVGGCTLEAVEAVYGLDDKVSAGAIPSVLDEITSLLDKSLLQRVEQGEQREPRLLMLETVHEYAWECLVGSGEAPSIQRLHAAYYLQLAEETEPKLIGAEQVQWLDRLERDHSNLQAAWQWLVAHGEPHRVRQPNPPQRRDPLSASSSRDAALVEPLTEREREVLQFVAHGLTNVQIAEQLVLSHHTVNNHVRSILSKLGVTSRSGATRFAVQQKLV